MKKILLLTCIFAFVTAAYAQTECESMLSAAESYFGKGEYEKASKMYKEVQNNCGDNYGGASSKLNECNRIIKEDADFKKCTTIEACDYYLSTYPSGRYVSKVKQKRSELIEAKERAQRMAEEEAAYARCTTEAACLYYLETYPNGKYYSKVLAKKNELEAERLRRDREVERSAFMEITKIEFANTDYDGNIIDPYGSTLYASNLKYLKPRITYNGKLNETKYVTLYCRIVKPDGSIKSNTNSPSGYTYSDSFQVQPGIGKTYGLTSWGSSEGNTYVSGNYKYEIWYEGNRIYQASFTVKDKGNAMSRGVWRTALRKCRDYPVQTYDDGSSYKGELYDGKRSGLGMYSWTDDDCYIGRFSSNKRNGLGIYLIKDGTLTNCPQCKYFVGEWSMGDKSGTGTCYDEFGNLIYYGSFVDNAPTQTYPMTGYDSYKFECKEYTGGDYYIGETKNGSRHGRGVYIWSDGDMWYGEWTDGERDGYGIFIPYQGSMITGTWNGDTME